jgi:FkbM family methyltransferase
MVVRRVLRKVLPSGTYRQLVGRHEDGSLRLWTRIAANVPAGASILDIGAFEGEYALAARRANTAALICAFEPNPNSARQLRAALETHRVMLVEAALSDEEGQIPFVFNGAESRVARNTRVNVREDVRLVNALTLDGWSAANAATPSLIKIDVEGAEVSVLRGAQRILAECRPIILCEVLSDAAGTGIESVLPKQYRFYHIDENVGIRREPRITRRVWRNKNWLLVPDSREAEVPVVTH